MRRQAALPVTGGLLYLVAAAAASAASPVPPPAGPALAPRSHGFMLYLSQPLGGGGGGAAVRPHFGFRIDQVRMAGNNGAPDAGDPLQRRSLIGWQMDGRSGFHPSAMKLELGGRVTYDVAHGSFSALSSRAGANQSSARSAAVTSSEHTSGAQPKSFELHGLEFHGSESHGTDENVRPFSRDLFHEASGSSSSLHEIAAAAIATFKSSHSVPVQQRSRPSERPLSMAEAR